jgi:hypothetical protein
LLFVSLLYVHFSGDFLPRGWRQAPPLHGCVGRFSGDFLPRGWRQAPPLHGCVGHFSGDFLPRGWRQAPPLHGCVGRFARDFLPRGWRQAPPLHGCVIENVGAPTDQAIFQGCDQGFGDQGHGCENRHGGQNAIGIESSLGGLY